MVGQPRVQMLSFTATGTPARGGASSPAARESHRAASSRAWSGAVKRYARTTGSSAAMRSSTARTTSVGEHSRRR